MQEELNKVPLVANKKDHSIYKPERWFYAFSPKYLSFGFISPYMKLKDKEMMKDEDLPEIPSKDDPMKLGKYLEDALKYEEQVALLNRREPSLMRALLRAYHPFLIICIFSLILIDMIRFSVGIIIRRIVSDLQKPMPLSNDDRVTSIINFVLVFGIMLFSSISIPHIVFFQYRFIFRIYASLATNILWRGLRKSGGLLVRKSIDENGLFIPFVMDMNLFSSSSDKNNSFNHLIRNLFNNQIRGDEIKTNENLKMNSDNEKKDSFDAKNKKISFDSNDDSENNKKNVGNSIHHAIRLNYINIYNVMMGDLFPCSILIGNLISVLLFPIRLLMASFVISKILSSSISKTSNKINEIINISLLCCITTLIIFISISAVFQIKSGYLRRPLFFAKDCRLDELRYVLSNIRTIKLLDWEGFVYKNLVELRTYEMYWRSKKLWLRGFSDIFCFCSNYISQAVLFATLGLLFKYNFDQFSIPGMATVPIIFCLSTLFTSVSLLPEELGFVMQGFVSLGRIQTFLFSRLYDYPLLQDKEFINRKNKFELKDKKKDYSESEIIEEIENKIIDNELSNISLWYINATFSRQIYDHPIDRFLHQLGYIRSCGGLDLLYKKIYYYNNYKFDIDKIENEQHLIDLSTLTEIKSLKKKSFSNKESIDKVLKYFEVNQESGFSNNDHMEFDLDSNFKSLGKLYPCITDINIKLKYGEICFIIGDHGSGKTTFIDTLLGELFRIRGDVYIGNKERNIDIVTSNPWIPHGTYREVILAGRKYNLEILECVTEICQLKTDIEKWKLGFDHLIEEYGNNLSNGQKARLSLARSIYKEMDPEKKISSNKIICIDSIFETLDPNVTINILNLLFSNNFESNSKFSEEILDLLIPSRNVSKYSVIITLNKSTFSYIVKHSFLSNFQMRFFNIKDMKISEFYFEDISQYITNIKDLNTESNIIEDKLLKKYEYNEEFYEKKNDKRYSNNFQGVCLSESGLLEAMEIESNKILSRENKELSIENQKVENKPFFEENFTELSGHVKLETYKWYLFGFFGKKNFLFLLILFIILTITITTIEIVVILWSGTDIDMRKNMIINRNFNNQEITDLGLKYMLIFVGITLFAFLIKFVATSIEINSIIKSSVILHNQILFEMLNSPLKFFDSLDSQSLVNIFSMDLGIIDGELNLSIILKFFSTIASQCFLLWSSPTCIILFPIFIFYYFIYIFKPTRIQTRESYRFLLNTYGPLCNKTECNIRGSSTIRNMKFAEYYKTDTSKVLYILQKTFYYSYAIGIWRLIRTLFFGIFLILLLFICPTISRILNIQLPLWITRYAYTFQSALISNFLVLSLSIIISLPNTISNLITNFIDLEKNMCSVQRFHFLQKQIQKCTSEDRYKSQSSIDSFEYHSSINTSDFSKDSDYTNLLTKSTNDYNGLLINDITMSYNNNIVINDLHLKIQPKEHIGLIGRTGSGKSSLFQCILGNYKLDKGFISIDGINIESYKTETNSDRYQDALPKQKYGQNIYEKCMKELNIKMDKNHFIGYIPQNNIFIRNWTIRNYIDPHNEFKDEQIWKAVDDLSFNSLFKDLPLGLDSIVYSDNYDSNINRYMHKKSNEVKEIDHIAHKYLFSLSQLRLISFLRIYLNSFKYKILLVDEPPLIDEKESINNDYCSLKTNKISVKVYKDKEFNNNKFININFSNIDNEINCKIEKIGSDDNSIPSIAYLINQHFKHCIVIIIAHHVESIKYCDKIFVMGQGQIEKVIDIKKKDNQNNLHEIFKLIKN